MPNLLFLFHCCTVIETFPYVFCFSCYPHQHQHSIAYLTMYSTPSMLLTVDVSAQNIICPNIMPCFMTFLTCIFCVSYWCSNYYIFLCTFYINILVCLDHSLNIWQYFNQSLSKHLTATANNTYEFCFCDYLMVFIVIKLSITDILFLPAACICGILLLFFPFCVIFTNTCTFDFYYHLYRYF